MTQQPRNARFWAYINDGWVRITIKPDQRLQWGKSSPDEEGWSSECYTWEWDGDVLTEEYDTDGRDCDGRMSTHNRFYAHGGELQAEQVMDWSEHPNGPPTTPIPGMFTPHWNRGECHQRDYAAEAMNY